MIIETVTEYEEAQHAICNSAIFLLPIPIDIKSHPAVSELVCVYLNVIEKDRDYIISLSHKDSTNQYTLAEIASLISGASIIYTPFKKDVLYFFPDLESKIIDIAGIACLIEECDYGLNIDVLRPFFVKYNMVENVNSYIPIMKLIEFGQTNKNISLSLIQAYNETKQDFKFHNFAVIPTCQFIEQAGLFVNSNFSSFFSKKEELKIHNSLIYSQYNPYTTTGRITNRFGSINFAALNKKNGERSVFSSRFNDGILLMFDFDGFHIRIIADLMNYQLSDTSIHQEFAKQYYNTDEITDQMYNEAKIKTFAYLYGYTEIDQPIDFFDTLKDFKNTLWQLAVTQGYIETPKGRRFYKDKIENCTEGKLFNYFLQAIEMEVSIEILNNLRAFLMGHISKMILYTYDAILIDYSISDGKVALMEIIKILECNGKYPVKIYRGKTYNDMENVTNKIKQ